MGVHYGHIGGMFSSAAKSPDGEIVGMVEANDALYARYTRNLDIPRFNSLEQMLETARPELVLEGVVHREKVEVVEQCAAAGANVLLDKPLCYDLDDLERMRCAVKESGIALSMWFTSRSYPPFLAVREAILAGELGEIVSIISTHPHKTNRETGTPWYFDSDQYTGTFHDVACHGVDQVRWLTGAECVGVHALQTCKKFVEEPRLIDHAQASFQMSNDSLATLTADWLTPEQSPSFGDTRVIIMGTEGSAHLRAYAGDHVLIVSNAKGAYEPDFPEDCGGVFVQELIESLREGRDSFISTKDVFAVSNACLMAQESAKQGGKFLKIGALEL